MKFTEKELREAVARVLAGEKIVAAVVTSTMSRNTIKRRLTDLKQGRSSERTRPGPKPLLPAECEADLVIRVTAMRRPMLPVQLWDALQTANELHRSIRGDPRSVTDLTHGWYTRFMTWHPELSLRASEPLSRARQGADELAFRQTFHSMSKAIIGLKLDATRIYNMDETSFVSKHQSKSVVAARGSSGVWTRAPETSFHLFVVAAVGAEGRPVPPLFVAPGKRISRTTLDGCAIAGAGIITAEKGFVDARIFELWIDHFADNIPDHVPRPVLLICDGCSSHLSPSLACRSEQRGVVLQLLPPNATHLIQPLGVAVFRGFKREVSKLFRQVLRHSKEQSLSKKEAVAVASAAYNSKVVCNTSAAANGFRACGLFPPSLPAMVARTTKSPAGGIIKSDLGVAS